MLYRFFSDNQYSLSSLANCYLWFSDVKDFNDPFEVYLNETLKYENIEDVNDCVFRHELRGQRGKYEIELDAYLNDLEITSPMRYQDFKKEVLETAKQKHSQTYEKYAKVKWCCFSEDNEEFGSPISRKLMWGHYGNGLRGFLIEFNKKALIDSLTKSVQVNNPDNFVINARINYCDLKPIPFYNEFINKIKPSEKLNGFLTQKALEWRYESENRLGVQEQKVNYDPNTIKRIIIGEKMPKDFRETLLIIIKSVSPKVEIIEAYIDTEDFKIKTKILGS